MSVKITDFSVAVGAELDQYYGETAKAVKKAVAKQARLCRKEIVDRAPKHDGDYPGERGKKRTPGDYKKSWKSRVLKNEPGVLQISIYSTDRNMAAWLEKGHANRDGSRSREFPHIFPAAESARINLPERIEKAIEEVSK